MMAEVNQHIYIGGMSCTACAARITRELQALPGVLNVQVSFFKRDAQICYDSGLIRSKQIRARLEQLGYSQLKAPERALSARQIAGILLIIVALWLLITIVGQSRLIPDFPLAEEGASLGALFIVGLLTSFHCLGMCGGINLSQCIPAASKQVVEKTGAAAAGTSPMLEHAAVPMPVPTLMPTLMPTLVPTLVPALQYNLARMVAYTLVGAVVGALGSMIIFSGYLRGIVQLVAGLFMVLISLSMIGVLPSLAVLAPRLPAPLARFLGAYRSRSTSPVVVGLLTGLMPCGPMQAMQLYALGSGSALNGALAMLVFAAGTLPLMLGLGLLAGSLSARFTKKMSMVGATLVMLFGLLMFSSGWALSGLPDMVALSSARLSLLFGSNAAASVGANEVGGASGAAGAAGVGSGAGTAAGAGVGNATANATGTENAANAGANGGETPALAEGVAVVEGEEQVVRSILRPGAYPSITVSAGMPVRWLITADERDINGCNNRFIASDFNLEYRFRPGENLIQFTPESPGVYGYSCWMGMIRATITVV
jgi:sulfite exporter TauE/SafE/copper chaperone CopZ